MWLVVYIILVTKDEKLLVHETIPIPDPTRDVPPINGSLLDISLPSSKILRGLEDKNVCV